MKKTKEQTIQNFLLNFDELIHLIKDYCASS